MSLDTWYVASITCAGHATFAITPVYFPAASTVKSISTPSSSLSSMRTKSGRDVSPYICADPSAYSARRQCPIRAVPNALRMPPGLRSFHASTNAPAARSSAKSAYSFGPHTSGWSFSICAPFGVPEWRIAGAQCVWMQLMKTCSGAISGTSSWTRARTRSCHGPHTHSLSIVPSRK